MNGPTHDRFSRTELDNGLVILTERLPAIRSVALGIWVRSGSIHERRHEMGVSHLLEHMVFKGTTTRTAREIALSLERLGGALDAYTTREHTAYQARVLDEHLDLALDVLVDLVRAPLLRAEDLELERDVVLEEIATVEDTPDDLVFDLHAESLWGDHPYGYSILGTRETVGRLDAHALRRTWERGYVPKNLVVAAAGSVDHEAFVEAVAERFTGDGTGDRMRPVASPPAVVPRDVRSERASSQTHLVIGTQLFSHRDPRRYALVLLSSAFGGGMSSRLFQRVREELGLAYSVFSYQSFYAEGGMLGVYCGTRHEAAGRAAHVIRAEFERLAAEGLTAEELEDAKGQVKGQMVLSLESSSSRLSRLAGFALYDEPVLTLEELIGRVDAVTVDDAAALAAEYLDPAKQVTLRLGPGE